MGALGAWNGNLTRTIDVEIANIDNSADINTIDEIHKGKKTIEEAKNDFSLLYGPLDFIGMISNLTSPRESFVVSPNYAVVGESSTRALVNPNNLLQGNKVNNSG
ncbi:hypothetical protein FRX31_002032 [Thalictrum thalictroides]|uniref:Uncharacterized protein n=1 Tax=Thalictrum thalictroides TaxID=46969 RepID=A0A7J6XF15_THATH|nr:hypothetical protein FRX31_002032 [Thalictrum thalictroides]